MSSICLIHGHGVDASIWDGIYANLISEVSVLRPDLAQYKHLTTIEAYADEMKTRLKAEGVEQVTLIGHSMGGYIALAFAEKYPEQVAGLVLYHSTAVADDENRREVRRQAIEGLEKHGSTPFIQKQFPKMVAPDYPPKEIQMLVERYQDLPADALIAGLKAMAARPDRTHVLQKAHYPVLLVLGDQDQIIPLDKAVRLADLSDRISVSVIEQAGHLSMVEQPQQSIQVLRNFLKTR